jgi:hypothetical protein
MARKPDPAELTFFGEPFTRRMGPTGYIATFSESGRWFCTVHTNMKWIRVWCCAPTYRFDEVDGFKYKTPSPKLLRCAEQLCRDYLRTVAEDIDVEIDD